MISISITDSTGSTATDSVTITVSSAPPRTAYNLQVGAWGGDESIGNTGVGAEIRTNIYNVVSPDLGNSFWVGDNLQNGAFIQFGYELFIPGYYCMYGETVGGNTNCLGSPVTIGYGDARWFWQYWPNAKVVDFYGGIGPANSAGPEGSWHLYQILPNAANGWNFVLDGQTVWSFNDYKVTASKEPVYVAAEEVTSSPSATGTLGPVEFRNLTYRTTYGWNQATSLTTFSGCGILNPNCGISIPYGVTTIGPNDILAGSREKLGEESKLTFTLNAPSEATVLVDGQHQVSGGGKISLTPGDHLLLATEYVPVSDGVQLRFDHWSDGYPYADRNIDLNADTTLEAVYVTQYKLTLTSPPTSSGDGWYDQGTTASFSSDTTPRFTDTSLMVFAGWLDENGDLLTWSGNGSVVMDGPHTLTARWLTIDYSIPILLAAVPAILITLIRRRKDQNDQEELPEELVEPTPPHRSNDQDSTPTSEAATHEPAPFPKENIAPSSQHITCRYCNAQVPRDRLICPKCGMPAGYL